MIQRLLVSSLFLLTVSLSACKPDEAVRTSASIDARNAMEQARLRAATSTPITRQEQLSMNDGRPVIACFGDSLTAGYGTNAGESYPDQLQKLLDQNGYHYRVVNLGVSGETTKDGLARIDSVLAANPAIIVVEFGGNDGLRGIPITNTRNNLDTILEKLTHTRSKVALAGITLPPQYGEQYVKQFNETYKIEASKYRLIWTPFLYKDVYGLPGMIQPDGIHATAQGNRQVAKNVFALLQPLLQK